VLREEQGDEIRAELKADVDQEVDRAWNAPDPEPESALLHVFADRAAAAHGAGGNADREEEQLENASSEVAPTLEDSTGDRS
jgi:TPP-dependent pyruvate/acetoin dehydrogenase alpha subunit